MLPAPVATESSSTSFVMVSVISPAAVVTRAGPFVTMPSIEPAPVARSMATVVAA
jgi:hypothetical protein